MTPAVPIRKRPFLSRPFVLVVLLLPACANPVPPSGGPEDTTPPEVIQSRPVRDTVNVSTDTEALYLEFSEYVERSGLPRALSVTPQFEQRLQFDWSGRSVEIEFPQPLRDNTTYLFTIDTNLNDVHGVSLDEPITVAFSTGPRINRGQIRGEVVSNARGAPQAGIDVYAYALAPDAASPPQPLPSPPTYRTQTSEEGTFAFNYMREQRYYVVALRDNNRNRLPDPVEPYAVPPRLALPADTTGEAVAVPWVVTRADTVAPVLQQAQPLSRQRVRVTFDEPVQLETRAPQAWAPVDSTTGTPVHVQAVYADPDRTDGVIIRTEPMETTRYRLSLARGMVTDSLGRAQLEGTVGFLGSSRADTTQTRFRGFLPAGLPVDSTGARPLLPSVQPGVLFNQSPDSTTLQRAIATQDPSGASPDFSLVTEDGVAYRLAFDPSLAPGQLVDVTVDGGVLAGPDSTYRRQFRRMTPRALGELAGQVVSADATQPANEASRPAAAADSLSADSLQIPRADTTGGPSGNAPRASLSNTSPAVVELLPVDASVPVAPRRTTIALDSTFVFAELPEGQFRFRAYLDRNGNGRWDGGRLQPYVPAEPVTWSQTPSEVRARWTTEMASPLRLPILAPMASPPAGAPVDTVGSAPEER